MVRMTPYTEYVGDWVNDQYNGYGDIKTKNSLFRGEFESGKMVSP